jgi:hypothetical protein
MRKEREFGMGRELYYGKVPGVFFLCDNGYATVLVWLFRLKLLILKNYINSIYVRTFQKKITW